MMSGENSRETEASLQRDQTRQGEGEEEDGKEPFTFGKQRHNV